MTIKPKNILLVKNRALGDAIISISTGNYLRSQFPDAKISFATPKWTIPVFDSLKHPFDEFVALKIRTPLDVYSLWQTLTTNQYDFIYELHWGPRSGRIFNLYTKIKSIPYGFHNHHKTKRDSIIRRDIGGVAKFLGNESFEAILPKIRRKSDLQKIVFGVVATRSTKMWPLEYFVELADRLKKEHPYCAIVIPLSKSRIDRQIKQRLIDLGLSKDVMFYEHGLNEVSKLFRSADIYIGNDTGLKHLAAFSGVKTISFFGPEEPLEWHPYKREEHPYFFLKNLDCRYKKAHFCGLDYCETMECLKCFSVDQVIELISSSSH